MENNIIWKDRKRILGMPISFTKYSIDDDRLYLEKGFFKSEMNEILLYRILDIKTTRTLGQKLFGVGTITLYSADSSNKILELKNIKKPKQIHKFISEIVEKERKEKKVIGKEIYGSNDFDDGNCDCECDNDNCCE